jgi:methylase of polypeptide subunit release factors
MVIKRMKVTKTEHTYRQDFINTLKDKIHQNYYISSELSLIYRDKSIRRKRSQFDIIIFNKEYITINSDHVSWNDSRAVVCVIDTKSRGKPINKTSYKGQIFEYLLRLNTQLGFLTNYNDITSFHLSNKRLNESEFFDSNEDIIDWICGILAESEKGIPHNKSINEIFEQLSKLSLLLYNESKIIDFNEIEEILKIKNFEDNSLYENLEEMESSRYRGASFLIISQILFYIILRNSRIKNHINFEPQLKSLMTTNGNPNQIQTYFDLVSDKINYRSIFSFRIFTKLPDSFQKTLKTTIEILEGLSDDIVIQNDLIGLMFQGLIPFSLRKKIAAYYTKPLAADLLVELLIENGDEVVLDPACGSGTLLAAAYNKKRSLMGLKSKHKKILQELIGSDISVFATILASVNLAIQDTSKWTNEVLIFNEDAFRLSKAEFQKYFDIDFIKKVFSLQTPEGIKEISKSGVTSDIIIMNPPFTRGSRISKEQREILLNLSKTYGLKHGWKKWNLYSSFILLGPKFFNLVKKSSTRSKIGIVLPLSAIRTQYMVPVWNRLFENNRSLGLKYIIKANDEDVSFSDSSEHEILVVLERGFKKQCKMINLKKTLSEYNLELLKIELIGLNESNAPSKEELFDSNFYEQEFIKNSDCRRWKFTRDDFIELIKSSYVKINEYDELEIGAGNSSKPVDYYWIPNKFWKIDGEEKENLIFTTTEELRKLKKIFKLLLSTDRKDLVNFKNNQIEIDKDTLKRLETIGSKTIEQFLKFNRDQVIKLINFSNQIKIPKHCLFKSMKRSIKDYYEFPPMLSPEIPFIYFLDESLLKKDSDYLKWRTVFDPFYANWVGARPRMGQLLMPVKIRLNTMKTLFYHSPFDIETARTIGIFIKRKNAEESSLIQLNILFAYLTSSIFLYDFIKNSRTQAEALKQLFKTDFLELIKLPNLKMIKFDQYETIANASIDWNSEQKVKDRKIFKDNIIDALENKNHKLYQLDKAWFQALNIPLSLLRTLYQNLIDHLSKF